MHKRYIWLMLLGSTGSEMFNNLHSLAKIVSISCYSGYSNQVKIYINSTG